MRHILHFLVFYLAFICISCSESDKKNGGSSSPRIKSLSKITSPKNGSSVIIGDSIFFNVDLLDSQIEIDSIVIEVAKGIKVTSVSSSVVISTSSISTGNKSFSIDIFYDNEKSERRKVNIKVLSDIKPDEYTYRVLNEYPHDNQAFTEGLLIDGNVMMESTGQKGFSSVRIVDMSSGKILKENNLNSQYFGEGIAVYNDYVYMLTWQAREGMIFNKKSLELIRKFNYPTEGWGMTTKDDTLVMSDGSEVLHFMEPQGFTEIKRIEVYDQNGPIDNLNELEYINGSIYANRWMTDLIYKIDPTKGKVLAVIDLSGLLDASDYDFEIDVLNGIAFDGSKNKIFVTGKNWPTLFEIEFIKRQNNI